VVIVSNVLFNAGKVDIAEGAWRASLK